LGPVEERERIYTPLSHGREALYTCQRMLEAARPRAKSGMLLDIAKREVCRGEESLTPVKPSAERVADGKGEFQRPP